VQVDLDAIAKQKIQTTIHQLRQALEEPDITTSLCLIEQAISSLDEIPVEAITHDETQTKLPLWEVEDYDQYFQVSHIQSTHSDRCLLYGLLTTCHRFFQMLQQDIAAFSPEQVARSRDGFASYAQLLQRVYQCEI
jgi:hypothetical protein